MVQTCESYPSQWDMFSADRYYYARFRSGTFRLDESKNKEEWLSKTKVLYTFNDGTKNGVLTYQELAAIMMTLGFKMPKKQENDKILYKFLREIRFYLYRINPFKS